MSASTTTPVYFGKPRAPRNRHGIASHTGPAPAPPDPNAPLHLRTASGRRMRIDVPQPGDIHFPDIAAQLAKLCRFAGATTTFYSVAQHSVLVADIVLARWPGHHQAALYGLLHDAHEVVIGDIPAPARDYLHRAVGWTLLDAYAQDIDEAVTIAAGLPWPVPGDIAQAVGCADRVARHAEARCLLAEPARGVPPWPELTDLKPWHKPVKPLPWDKAETLFVARLTELAGLAGVPLRL